MSPLREAEIIVAVFYLGLFWLGVVVGMVIG